MTKPRQQDRKSYLMLLRGILLVAAVVMIMFGLANGEAGTVLQKAVNICLECIGIG